MWTSLSTLFVHLYDWSMGSAQQIEQDWDHVTSLAADLHDAHARLVDFVAAVLTEGSWQAAGLRSPEHWLMLRAGLSRGQAAAILLLARRADELPATVTQLQRTIPRYSFTLQPATVDDHGHVLPGEQDHDEAPGPVEPATLTMGYTDGRFRLRYDAPAHLGALVEAALAEAKDHLFHTASAGNTSNDGDVLDPDHHVTDGGPPRITWADALTVLATRSLDHAGTSGTSGTRSAARRARYRVQVHLDTDGGWLTGQPACPATSSTASPATAPSPPSGTPKATPSTSAAATASFPTAPGSSCSTATAAVATPAARPPASSRSTT